LRLATIKLATTELKAMTPSIDRSIPPIMITTETPIAVMSRIELCLASPARFVALRNRGVIRVMMKHSPMRMSSGPTTAGILRSRPATFCRSDVVVIDPVGDGFDVTWLHSCAVGSRDPRRVFAPGPRLVNL
jgi:hypothetical protein